MSVTYHFHGDLPTLLRQRWRVSQPIVLPLTRAASIKDVIESFGLPHTEIERISCNGVMTGFGHRVEANQRFDLYPISSPWDIASPTLLRPEPLGEIRFVVDVNVGRLASYLRMAGFDTLYDPSWDNGRILREMEATPRILLTRNLDLLKRKQVVFGRYVSASAPIAQLGEILTLFGIDRLPHLLSRCLACNTRLQPVVKEEILHRLEPLTIQFFDSFRTCPHCDKIYWPGSHVDRMLHALDQAGIVSR